METDNKALVAAMANMKAADTDESKNEFVKLAVRASYFVPVKISPRPQNGVVAEGSTISYHNMKTKDGKSLLMAFTSFDELKKWEGYSDVIMDVLKHSYMDINHFVVDKKAYDGFIIDPYGENVALRTELMENIAKVVFPMKVSTEKIDNKDGNALKPATQYSQEMVDAIKAYLATNEHVNKAYLMETTRTGADKPTVIVAVDMDGGDIKVCFNAIGANARKFLAKDESIGVMPAKDAVAAAALAGVEPFYTK